MPFVELVGWDHKCVAGANLLTSCLERERERERETKVSQLLQKHTPKDLSTSRLHLLNLPPLPNSSTLGNKLLTRGPLGDTLTQTIAETTLDCSYTKLGIYCTNSQLT
jgi:hypothetical protein